MKNKVLIHYKMNPEMNLRNKNKKKVIKLMLKLMMWIFFNLEKKKYI